LLFIIELIFFISLKQTTDFLLYPQNNSFITASIQNKEFLVLNIYRLLYFVGFSTLYWSIKYISRLRKKVADDKIAQLTIQNEKAVLEANLARTNNAFLQQRLNPHLLFNSLDFIHSSVDKYSEEGADCVALLTEMMHFSLSETDAAGKVPLEDEVQQLHHLIKINQYRYNQKMPLAFHQDGRFENHRIIPLVLLTLAENVFTHGDPRKDALLSLDITEFGLLKFITQNAIKPRKRKENRKPTGLKNIQIRLNYTYGEDYRLTFNENKDVFTTELTLQL
jgi:LytS/YehU family sensor histidine kinase